MGTPDLKNYTIEADVMSDGNKRKMSTVGVINQRYRILLKGNEQVLEITSNEQLLMRGRRFTGRPTCGTISRRGWTWRRTVRASSAPRPGKRATRNRRPGPARCPSNTPTPAAAPASSVSRPKNMRVYIDNIAVTAN